MDILDLPLVVHPVVHPVVRISTFGHFSVKCRDPQGNFTGLDSTLLPSKRSSMFPFMVLKVLLCAPYHSASKEVLEDCLWPEKEHERATKCLYDSVSDLRCLLARNTCSEGDLVQKNPLSSGYCLAPYPVVWCDADAFQKVMHDVMLMLRLGTGDALPLLERAAALACAGVFLPEHLYDDWSGPRRALLSEQYHQCVILLAQAYYDHHLYEHAFFSLRSYFVLHPTDEDILCKLMDLVVLQDKGKEILPLIHQCRKAMQKDQLCLLPETEQQIEDFLDRIQHLSKMRSPQPRKIREHDVL
jgi:DNA-binding SARP family transcriptional activator